MKEINNHTKKQFQSKFNDFRAPFPEDGWDRIEASLNAASKTKVLRRRWFVGAAAAVAALIGGGILFMQQPALQIDKEVTEVKPTSTESTEEIQTNENQSATFAQSKTNENVQNARTFVKQPKGTIQPIVISTEKPLPTFSENKKESVEEIERREKELVISEIKKEDIKEKDRLIREFAESGQKNYFAMEQESVKSSKQNKTLLALGGRGGLTAFQKTVNAPMSLRSASLANEGQSEKKELYTLSGVRDVSSNIGDNISEMEHAQPVSVGVTVSKEIFDNLYIETGLMYTYLYSSVKNRNIGLENKENQEIHYLGVPFNVNYNIFSFHRLNVYAAMGVMLEKDIYGTRKYRSLAVNEYSEGVNSAWESEEIKQKNLQLSVNAGLGISLPVYKNLNLYGKIGGAYYFDAKNEYKTIYSDRKVLLDLNVGLRVEF